MGAACGGRGRPARGSSWIVIYLESASEMSNEDAVRAVRDWCEATVSMQYSADYATSLAVLAWPVELSQGIP